MSDVSRFQSFIQPKTSENLIVVGLTSTLRYQELSRLELVCAFLARSFLSVVVAGILLLLTAAVQIAYGLSPPLFLIGVEGITLECNVVIDGKSGMGTKSYADRLCKILEAAAIQRLSGTKYLSGPVLRSEVQPKIYTTRKILRIICDVEIDHKIAGLELRGKFVGIFRIAQRRKDPPYGDGNLTPPDEFWVFGGEDWEKFFSTAEFANAISNKLDWLILMNLWNMK